MEASQKLNREVKELKTEVLTLKKDRLTNEAETLSIPEKIRQLEDCNKDKQGRIEDLQAQVRVAGECASSHKPKDRSKGRSETEIHNVLTEEDKMFEIFCWIAQETWKDELFEHMVTLTAKINTENRTTIVFLSEGEDVKVYLLRDIINKYKDGEKLF